MTLPPDDSRAGGERWNGRVSITVTLTASIFLLVLVSVGSVLGVGVWLAQKNTFELLSRNAHQGIGFAADRVERHLRPAEDQAAFVARRITEGQVDAADRDDLGKLLTGALAAAPQIQAVMFIGPDLQTVLAGRDPQTGRAGLFDLDYSDDPEIRNRIRRSDGPIWNAPIWRDDMNQSYLSLAHPVVGSAGFAGVVVSVVSVADLSAFLRQDVIADGASQFILYGRDRVLAHPRLTDPYPGRTPSAPLPTVQGFEDPVLAAIWQSQDRFDLGLRLEGRTDGHVVRLPGDEDYIFIYREVSGFGPEPLIVGAYFPAVEVGTEIRRMIVSLVAGIAALLLALVAAIVLGRRIAKPIVRFSEAAGRIRDLDVDRVGNLPGSIFRELNDQAKAFNAMLQGLRWFELYVPRKIVSRLVQRGEGRDALTSSRRLTVMFTDIAGFSTISEGMTAPEVARFVNSHFELAAGCIEAEDGTVDKFIGDSVMAFWGAPDPVDGAEEHACRAALAIAAAVRADNEKRVAAGLSPVRMRIGIHTGEATVGNIGAPGRINYTIIGDTVNVGQRLEQLGKELCSADSDISILISAETRARLGPDWKLEPAGTHELKGRRGSVEVFKLG
ncbi:MAG: adenylate/guanylate cyclase domain-containing protein [Minwuia sp.]|uniref:adenylate/guanylate cyclase domain-containing protein n=1 Tax=Minwuia sp. TaxID=2493630 RepID=UPI003A8C47A9